MSIEKCQIGYVCGEPCAGPVSHGAHPVLVAGADRSVAWGRTTVVASRTKYKAESKFWSDAKWVLGSAPIVILAIAWFIGAI
jgi:hypothetical protein